MTEVSRSSGRSPLELALDAAGSALADAGLAAHDLDGVVTYQLGDSASALEVAGALGVPLVRWYGELQMGGPGATLAPADAALAVSNGLAETVLVFRAMNGSSGVRMSRFQAGNGAHGARQWTLPYGFAAPAQIYAMWARRHMAMYGTTTEQLGHVAVTLRAHAQRNPGALFHGKPMTLADHQESRPVSLPFRLLDCCLETDGAAALVVTTEAHARDCRKPPVFVAGFANGAGPSPAAPGFDWPDYTTMYPAYHADAAFAMAGLAREDVDLALLYDAFTFAVIAQLEDLGFVAKGEGGPFVQDGQIGVSGSLPVNPNGGLLSEGYIHGLNNVVEAVRQIRREAGARQVAGAEVAVVTAGEGARGGVMLLHA